MKLLNNKIIRLKQFCFVQFCSSLILVIHCPNYKKLKRYSILREKLDHGQIPSSLDMYCSNFCSGYYSSSLILSPGEVFINEIWDNC